MAFNSMVVYTQTLDNHQIFLANKAAFEELLQQIVNEGFTDISISNYLNFVQNNPNVAKDFPAIKALVLAKINEMSLAGEIGTEKFQQLSELLRYIEQNLTQINTITVNGFKTYLLSQPMALEESSTLNIQVLDLNPDMLYVVQQNNITTVGEFVSLIRYYWQNGITISQPSGTFDFGDCISKLYKMGLLDRIEAGLILKHLCKLSTRQTEQILEICTSENLVSFLTFKIPQLRMKFLLSDFFYIEELVYVLTHELRIFSLEVFSKNEIGSIATILLEKGFITQDQFNDILSKYQITAEV